MTIKTPMYWTRYCYHINHPDVKAVVEKFNVEGYFTPADFQPLADLLNEIDLKEGKGKWVSDGTSLEWNLGMCCVNYNGPNDLNFPTKGSMQNVLILGFSGKSLGPIGQIYIPYND